MKKSLASLFAVGALALLPAVASAGGRFGTDRGFRYGGGGWGGGHSHSFFGISLGFGSGGWCGNGFSTRFSYSNYPRFYGGPIYRSTRFYGGYGDYCASPVVVVPSAPLVYSPPVVYTAPPVVYSAPPVVYSAPVYSAPVVVTPVRTYYYSGSSCYYGGGYVYRR